MRLSSSEAGLAELSLPYDDANRAAAMALDSDDNLLVCGCALPTERSVRANSALKAGAFVAKYAQTGEQLWRRELSGDGSQEEQGDCSSVFIATDENANVFIAGTTIVTSVSVNEASHDDDASDMFVAKMTASGDLVWRKTMGTAQRDEATAIRVDPSGSAVYVTGFSGGDMTQRESSSSVSNCAQWSSTNSTNQSPAVPSIVVVAQECLAGVVLKLETLAGELLWVHQVVSKTSDGVFSVDVDGNGSLVVVGDTKGDLRTSHSDSTLAPHAGDLFVRKLDKLTGEAHWTTQLGGGGSTADLCKLPVEGSPGSFRRRGNCGIVIVSSSSSSEPSVYLTGTTFGVISTLDQDQKQYAALCDSTKRTKPNARFFETPDATVDTNDCAYQAVFAKVRVDDGKVEWIRQVVSTSRTSTEGLTRLPVIPSSSSGSNGSDDDNNVVVLGLADPGFLSSSELDQLFILRATATGETQWLQEVGLSGEDHALGIATTSPAAIANESLQLLVMGVGNRESSRVASESDVLWTAYARKLDPLTGDLLPFCEDAFSFQMNATSVQQLRGERVVVSVTVERSNERCGGDSSVSYAIEASDSTDNAAARPGVDFIASKGLVHFAALQKSATVAVINMLPATSEPSTGSEERVRSLTLVLERVPEVESVLKAPLRMEITIQMATISTTTGTHPFLSTSGATEAADGHFWRWLSRICALAIGLALLFTVSLGWLCGGVCGCTCLRKAKVFQYKRIKSPRASSHATTAGFRGLDEPSLRRKSSSQALSGALEPSRSSRSPRLPSGTFKASELELEAEEQEQEEDEELREHLSEIQQLNASLEALILNSSASGTAQRRRVSANEDDSAVVLQVQPNGSPGGVVTPILSAPPVGPLSVAALANVGVRRSKARKKVREAFPVDLTRASESGGDSLVSFTRGG